MGGGGAEPDQAPPPLGGMGMGSNPGMPTPPPMNYGYQQPQQQNYYGGGGSGAPAPAFEAPPPPAPAPANLMNPYQQQQQLPPSQPQNAGFAGGFQQPTGYQPMTSQPLQHATPQPVQKGPIPADHQILQEVFDGLKNRCLSASNH